MIGALDPGRGLLDWRARGGVRQARSSGEAAARLQGRPGGDGARGGGAAVAVLWLATYGANKLLIRGLLAHYGKPELLPLIFDDLAEVHRISGVSDAEPPPDGTATPSPANLPVSSIASEKRSARVAIALERQKLTAPGFGGSAYSTNRVIRASFVRPRSKRSSRTSPTGNTSALPRRIKLSRRCFFSTFKCSGSRSLG